MRFLWNFPSVAKCSSLATRLGKFIAQVFWTSRGGCHVPIGWAEPYCGGPSSPTAVAGLVDGKPFGATMIDAG
ncbi:hypothetical protein B296_00053968 [Ensete ventricosum]|uniref:Uncharacterized protein n=1 Tax=Ensete ventricosum TaxID=4639 RepID=A0A426WZY2_ENSVE|nr:hypothetical protein B296_00053968 [Ensete ventricosum]